MADDYSQETLVELGKLALKMSRNKVRRYLRSEGLPRDHREARSSKLDPYKRYIDERVNAAAPDWIPATVLLRELRALGYHRSRRLLSRTGEEDGPPRAPSAALAWHAPGLHKT